MPQFTAITRRRVSVTLPSGSNVISIGGAPFALPTEAGAGIDPWAADVLGDVWAVCIGVDNDHVYLAKLSGGTPVDVSGEEARSAWIDELGVVSYVPELDPYVVKVVGSSATTPSADTKHPAWPMPGVKEVWDGVTVTDIHRSGEWECASEAFDPNRRVVARYQGGPVLDVWRGSAPKPARVQAHDDGSCTVCIQIPAGIEEPVFVPSSAFTRFVADPPTFPQNPNRCAVVIDGEPGVPWFADIGYPKGTLGVLHHQNEARKHELDAHVQMARSKGLPLYFYFDTHEPDDVFLPDLPDDLAWMPMIQCYPQRGETPEDTADRFSALFWKASLHPRFAVFACGFLGRGTAGERTEAQVLHGLSVVAKLAAEHPRCRLVSPYTWERDADNILESDDDGVGRMPRVLEAVRAWQTSVSDPFDYPTVAELLPAQPSAPKPPTPKPPVPTEPVVPPADPRPHATKSTREIKPGEILYSDTFIDAPNKQWRFYHQTDGQGVMLAMRPDGSSSPAGSTGTTDRPDRTFVMQYEGNLVAYGGGKDYWASAIWQPNSKAVVTDAGQLALEAPNGDRAAVDLKTGALTTIERAAQPHVEPTDPVRPARIGAVRLDNRAFADDGGPFNPLGATLFWALWGEKNDADRLDHNLAHLAEHGVDYIRMLGMVGAPSWEDRTIDPNAGDYWQTVFALFERLKRRGIRAQVTVFADAQVMMPDRSQRKTFVDAWAKFANDHADQVLALEVANEHYQNGFEDVSHLREIGRRLADQTPIPVALSSPFDGTHVCEVYAGSAADFVTLHYDRDISKADGLWRPVRQPWGFPAEYEEHCQGQIPRVAVSNEPIGPQSSVAADDDPLRLALSYAATFVSGNAAYVYHAGAGIRGGGAADAARGRLANLFDYDAAILDALAAMRALLPAGLANWARHNSQWASMPWNGFQTAVEDGRLMRAYASTSGHEVVLLLLNQRDAITVTARDGYRMTRHDPLTGAELGGEDVPSGSQWHVPATQAGSVFLGARL